MPVGQECLGQEAALARRGTLEAVDVEVYKRTTLSVTGRLRRSVVIRFFGRAFGIGFDTGVAPYAPPRRKMTGTSKSDGHLLDMNPGAYLRAHYGNSLRAIRRQGQKKIIGEGGRSASDQ